MNKIFCDLIKPNSKELEKLEMLYNIHMESPVNVTSIKGKDDFYIKHYLDSIFFFKKNNIYFKTLIDIGSGGGFPGMVLAIFYPTSHIFLIESIRKKCCFLEKTIRECKINNVTIINDRAENVKELSGEIITSRAVGTIKEILKFSIHLSTKLTKWVIYKGEEINKEITESDGIRKKYNLNLHIERINEPFKRTYITISY
jgi:16S rRNA (guanine527-N7)-methyltransferase